MANRRENKMTEHILFMILPKKRPSSLCQLQFLNQSQARKSKLGLFLALYFPENIPENLGRKSAALRNAFPNPRNTPEKNPENFSGPRSFRDF